MGHSQMLLAVAGLEEKQIQEKTEMIGSGDWDLFSPAERLAFALAYKLSKDPAALSDAERHDLVQTFGPASALDLVWNIAWSNYMTRFADAFQLPLEDSNVFDSRPAADDSDPDRSGEEAGEEPGASAPDDRQPDPSEK